MDFLQNFSDLNYKINSPIISSKNNIRQDITKNLPSNQMTINFSESNNNNLSSKPKEYISSYENEEKEFSSEEEEINSD